MGSGKYDRTAARSLYDIFAETGREILVPRFQRNFAWDDTKVEQLWADFVDTFQDYFDPKKPDESTQYLLGPIVLVKNDNKFFVIDGQQRLATLTILFCLVRDQIINLAKPSIDNEPKGLTDITRVTENQHMEKFQNWKIVLNDSDKKLLEEIQEYEMDVNNSNYKSPDEKINDWNARKKNPATRDEFTDSMKLIISAYELLLKKMKDSLYTGFESDVKADEILNDLNHDAENVVDQKIKNDPGTYGLSSTFFEDLEYLKQKNFTNEEKQDYEAQREKKNKSRIRFPDLDAYVDHLIKKTERDYENAKKQEVVSEENQQTKQKMKENLPKFLAFITHILENNFVIEIIVDDDEDAFQIFETLNERGLALSKSNLIKNHVIAQISDEAGQKDVSDDWNQIFDEIIGSDQKDDDFIRESLRSRYFDNHTLSNGKTVKASKTYLYKIVKSMVNDEETARKFLNDLKKDSQFIKLLNDPTKLDSSVKTKDSVLAIRALSAQHIRVPIITAYRRWGIGHENYTKLVDFLVKFFFQFRTVRINHPGEIDKIMIKCAKDINDGKELGVIINELKEHDDQPDFEYNFRNNFEPKTEPVAKYVLAQITRKLGSPYSDIRPVENLTLEHILPQKPEQGEWDNFFDNYDGTEQKKPKKFLNKIGNLTLLTQPINSTVSNKGFDKKKNYKDADGKKKGYNSSELEINLQTVVNQTEWTATIVEERTDKFTELAKQIWSLD